MNIIIAIPTYQRIDKLIRCINSIRNQTYNDWKIILMIDNQDYETFLTYYSPQPENYILPFLARQQTGVITAWNFVFEYLQANHADSYDAVLWSVDDVEWYPNALEEAVNTMTRLYPDTDGIIGTVQECPGREDYNGTVYGQVLIGKEFIKRYKDVNYQVCCPEYTHWYQDEELWKYACSLNKFTVCETVKLKHYHPGFIKTEKDETHLIPRGKIKIEDDKTYKQRIAKELIWGKSWELVNKEEIKGESNGK